MYCQRTNRKIVTEKPELHPVPVRSPWYHIGIDFIGPLKVSQKGNRLILTLSDYCTKWVEAIGTTTKEAINVANSLFKIFMRMGLPHVVTSDQGGEFVNNLNNELMKCLRIRHHLTIAYHPQANGLDERFNQTLCAMTCFISTCGLQLRRMTV
uniref:Integrase catalytic domain-containing protein n=1 Tax=Amphimedon queenslandica TaxID=400682 RepID=A0A1X7TKA8_AMPQE